MSKLLLIPILAAASAPLAGLAAPAKQIQHDAEHYVLLHQYQNQWAAEDKEIDKKLADIREKIGGKKPNIVYILIALMTSVGQEET